MASKMNASEGKDQDMRDRLQKAKENAQNEQSSRKQRSAEAFARSHQKGRVPRRHRRVGRRGL